MSATMIVLAATNPNETEAAKAYSDGVKPILKTFAAEVIERYSINEQVVGQQALNTNLLVKFNSAESIKQFLNSDAYQTLIPLRDQGFASMQIYIAEQ